MRNELLTLRIARGPSAAAAMATRTSGAIQSGRDPAMTHPRYADQPRARGSDSAESKPGRQAFPIGHTKRARPLASPSLQLLTTAYGSTEIPFVVSVTVMLVNTTVMGGLQSGWKVAVPVRV